MEISKTFLISMVCGRRDGVTDEDDKKDRETVHPTLTPEHNHQTIRLTFRGGSDMEK